ncbi:RsbRD N-terminal domain-containing protein [Streptomyces canus]|uniref:RsbRD N-terminal domain-containing protein n=1 Tax=Streptomyces canus TaxID=58343 RepID=UPI00381DA5FA
MQVAEHDTAPGTAKELGAFLERRREQIAQRWADAALFRTVFTVSRDEAVEAGKAVVDALADVTRSGRLEDVEAPGFGTVRDQLGRMAAARARAGFTPVQIAGEVAGLREPVTALLRAEFQDDDARGTACTQALAVLTSTLRLVIMETTVSAGEELIARQRQQLLEVATPVIKLWDGVVAVPLIGTLDSARSQVVMESLYTTGGGLGMGLSGAKRLVKEFALDSRPGQGTTVTITDWVSGLPTPRTGAS